MKKNLTKIFAIASTVVAIILIVLLGVTCFGGISTADLNNELVQGLVVTLAGLYFLLALVTIVLAFASTEVMKEVTVHTQRGGSMRVKVKVLKKMAKDNIKKVEGVKVQKVAVVSDEYGVRLKLSVKVVNKESIEVETYIRTLLEDVYFGEFGFKFHTIEIKITALQPKYRANQEAIEKKVKAKLEEMRPQEAVEETVEEPVLTEQPVVEEAPVEEVAEEVVEEELVVEEA